MLRLSHLSKSFGRLQVVKDLSVDFGRSQVVCLIGPNGSGKTTMIKCILGLVIPDEGKIVVNSHQVGRSWNYRRAIGYMPQINRFPDNIKVKQLFEMIKDIRQHRGDYDEELYRAFNIELIGEKRMSTLSGGMRQKVNAALAFLFNPAILILDEPTAGLDPAASEILKEKILSCRTEGKLIVITTHNMSDVEELADQVMLLHDGTLKFYGQLSELKTKTGSNKLSRALIEAYSRTADTVIK
ncbi:MAG: ABC transporter ATP-binding protein [Chitinophagales bacterium]|nr:ABC transporter ATP-binding protein [Bacteroidota bacterium]MBX7141972.1 ABC transporter ATP-binding protein [Chitinophagales bacterium]